MRATPWGVVFWMPYDNNLAVFEAPIVGQLRDGLQPDVPVAIQVDRPGGAVMRRILMQDGHVRESEAGCADGSSASALASFLDWAGAAIAAERWAVVFLGHGGRVNEFSPDEDIGSAGHSGNRRWMSLDDARSALDRFRTGRQIALVFLQNCCKGTLEANYTFRETSTFTLSSQTALGAPNYYYAAAMRFLQENPGADGADLAETIMASERGDMFTGYCLVESASLEPAARLLDGLLADALNTGRNGLDLRGLPSYRYAEERLADLRGFAEHVARTCPDMRSRDEFLHFYERHLIRRYRQSPLVRRPELSGLSLVVPSSQTQIAANRRLDLYRAARLGDFFEAALSRRL